MKKINFIPFIFFCCCMFHYCHTLKAQIVINELYIKPTGTTSAADHSMYDVSDPSYGKEWVELYNINSCDSIDISCYILGSNMPVFGIPNNAAFAFPNGTKIPPLGFLVVGAPSAPVPVKDFNLYEYTDSTHLCGSARFYLQNSDGWMALYDPSGNVEDAVFWTSNAGESSKLTDLGNEFDEYPCNPNTAGHSCSFLGTLEKASAMSLGTEIEYGGKAPGVALSLYRATDGSSTWNTDGTPTPKACNGACVTGSGVSATILSSNDASCGLNNGNATASGTGGTRPYSFKWSTGGITDSVITNLAAGNYVVTVTEADGCKDTAMVTINQTSSVSVFIAKKQDATCGSSNGSATASGSGGTKPYSFKWSSGGVTDSVITNLSSGNYVVTVTEAGGCKDTTMVTINQTSSVSIFITQKQNASCGSSNGSAVVSASGGTPSYNYSSSNGQDSSTLTGLAVGSYSITATDQAGCNASTIILISSLGGPVAGIFLKSDVSCNSGSDGEATVTVSAGSPPYTFKWSLPGNSDSTITGLSAGLYTLTVRDVASCIELETVQIDEPSLINLSLTKTDSECGNSNGTATATVIGGTSPYTYLWSNSSTSSEITSLTEGTYSVTVLDANNCLSNGTINITNSDGPTFGLFDKSDVSCKSGSDGEATVTVSAGSPPYTFKWSSPGSPDSIIIGLTAGLYTLTVTDAAGCMDINTVQINEPSLINLSLTKTDSKCGNPTGTATATITGGTSPYTYLWSNNSTSSAITALTEGTYYVTILDANNCLSDGTVKIDNSDSLAFGTYDKSNVSCKSGSDGSIITTVSGGTAPYSYSWNNGDTDSISNNLPAGTYMVTVLDVNNCTNSISILISEPTPVVINITGQDATCGKNNATASISVTGGTPSYILNWKTGTLDSSSTGLSEGILLIYENLSAGNYFLDLTDTKGCKSSDSLIITAVTPSVIKISNDTTINKGSKVNLSVEGGKNYKWSPVDYLDNPESKTPVSTPTSSITYNVLVTDLNGCSTLTSVTITVKIGEKIVFIPNAFSPNNDNENDIFFVNGNNIYKIDLSIFNRWGEVVFQYSGYELESSGWDGNYKNKELNPAVFMYVAKVEYSDGTSEIIKGNISLIR